MRVSEFLRCFGREYHEGEKLLQPFSDQKCSLQSSRVESVKSNSVGTMGVEIDAFCWNFVPMSQCLQK